MYLEGHVVCPLINSEITDEVDKYSKVTLSGQMNELTILYFKIRSVCPSVSATVSASINPLYQRQTALLRPIYPMSPAVGT